MVEFKQIPKYRNALHCAYSVVKQEGIVGLYRGFSASLLGLSESTFQFAMYEYLKKTRIEQRQKANIPNPTQ